MIEKGENEEEEEEEEGGEQTAAAAAAGGAVPAGASANDSGKLKKLIEILREILDKGEKVLIFTQVGVPSCASWK